MADQIKAITVEYIMELVEQARKLPDFSSVGPIPLTPIQIAFVAGKLAAPAASAQMQLAGRITVRQGDADGNDPEINLDLNNAQLEMLASMDGASVFVSTEVVRQARSPEGDLWAEVTPADFHKATVNGYETRVLYIHAAAPAVPGVDAPGFVQVPVDAYLWLMGMGEDGFFTGNTKGMYWWRSAFNERAGLDMMAIHEANKSALATLSTVPDEQQKQSETSCNAALRAAPAGRRKEGSCDHVWPESEGQTDIYGKCAKCGMSFQRYIHTECP